MLRRESAHEGMFTNPPAPLTRHHSHHLLWHQRERFFLKKKDSGSRSSACTATNPSSQPHLLDTRPALTQWRPRTRMRQGPDTPSFFTLHFAEWCGVTISYEPLAWATGIRMTLLFAKQPSFSFVAKSTSTNHDRTVGTRGSTFSRDFQTARYSGTFVVAPHCASSRVLQPLLHFFFFSFVFLQKLSKPPSWLFG